MAQSAPAPGTRRTSAPMGENPWAVGGVMFAGVLLMVDGVMGVIKGIAGIASDEVYARISNYTFKFDVTAWGWIHLVLGVVLLVVGWGILKGAGWAKATGVVLAALNMIANFMWLPYQPIWAIISIAIDAFVIWALCTDRSAAVI
ncbi:hypothetical protein OHA79_16770 [Streptomyces sp. NBC_00841]|uniref:DUF7144 family membrane protein n=1 Tax=unclassified Streptomyces TaxID=2593676 RepID=UPI0022599899|nr:MULTISPECIES: hypothetical protein [unclassified Streptomyces]MCX4535350.1 hypothetical protein [Streptomyces sp. NBC_01669]WRZ99350.1 hypothetical protein OHA79_16770 [Streptomyces sp. NBC_00841]